jgi:acyl carrier protein
MTNSIPSRDDVLRILYATIDEFNESTPPARQLAKMPETNLFGASGALDSLGLVNFIVLLEQRIGEECGVAITLADEKALSRKNSPFLTVDSLSEYIIEQLKGLEQ